MYDHNNGQKKFTVRHTGVHQVRADSLDDHSMLKQGFKG
jgi:hypothetical protein